jgi:hypothetical protein
MGKRAEGGGVPREPRARVAHSAAHLKPPLPQLVSVDAVSPIEEGNIGTVLFIREGVTTEDLNVTFAATNPQYIASYEGAAEVAADKSTGVVTIRAGDTSEVITMHAASFAGADTHDVQISVAPPTGASYAAKQGGGGAVVVTVRPLPVGGGGEQKVTNGRA